MFDFRPLTLEDLPLVHRFLHAPHAKRWFGQSMADVERDYGASVRGDEAFKTFIVTLEGAAVGFVTFGFFGDYPDMQRAYGVTDPDAANCDVLLAERAHEGRGAVLIRELAERIIFASPRTTTLVIDPLPENAIAIRAYEKAGFRFLRAVPNDGEGNALYLLELDRATFAARAPEPFHIRPGRSSEMDLARRIDDDAVEAFREVGLGDFTFDRGYSEAEVVRWKACADRGRLLFACADGSPVGFIAIGAVDGKPYIDQISVRRAYMRRGIGSALLLRALRTSVRDGEVWLTTNADVPWNAPWYARFGFERVAEVDAPRELRALLECARPHLPWPDREIVMVCRGEAFGAAMRRAS